MISTLQDAMRDMAERAAKLADTTRTSITIESAKRARMLVTTPRVSFAIEVCVHTAREGTCLHLASASTCREAFTLIEEYSGLVLEGWR